MQRSIVLAAVAAATVLTATAANAGRVDWSIGINVPPIAAVVGAPAYYPAPAYYNAPTYYDNPPAYYAPPVVYAPRPRSWLPPPPLPRIGWGVGWERERWAQRGWDHDRGDRGDRDRGDHDRGRHDGRVDWRR